LRQRIGDDADKGNDLSDFINMPIQARMKRKYPSIYSFNDTIEAVGSAALAFQSVRFTD